jgi:plasmid stabilization system protein ParE
LILALLVKVKPRARREVLAAAQWWRLNRPAAPGAVAADLKDALELLAEFPGIGTKVEDAKDPETRRWWLERVRYHIYYRPRGRHLEVVAFWGGERERGPSV